MNNIWNNFKCQALLGNKRRYQCNNTNMRIWISAMSCDQSKNKSKSRKAFRRQKLWAVECEQSFDECKENCLPQHRPVLVSGISEQRTVCLTVGGLRRGVVPCRRCCGSTVRCSFDADLNCTNLVATVYATVVVVVFTTICCCFCSYYCCCFWLVEVCHSVNECNEFCRFGLSGLLTSFRLDRQIQWFRLPSMRLYTPLLYKYNNNRCV